MSDSSEIDAALIAKLQGDATLAGLMPDGVYFDLPPQGATKVIVISIDDQTDVQQFQGRGFEDAVYLVKAMELSTSGANVKTAAKRIDELLNDGTLTIAGYLLTVMQRIGRVRITEVDQTDPSIRWQYRGGRYQIITTPLP